MSVPEDTVRVVSEGADVKVCRWCLSDEGVSEVDGYCSFYCAREATLNRDRIPFPWED